MPGLNALETIIIVTLHAIVIIVTICIHSLWLVMSMRKKQGLLYVCVQTAVPVFLLLC